MCKSIALLSGKGGSGKTTLALSMATMLSDCGVKVLLIDCDLSTNGATYFYEEKLAAKKNRITSFHDILFSEKTAKMRFVEINEYYHFLPSITQISKKNTKVYTYKNDSTFSAYAEICQKYDVVLFDCQAGYTDILKLILPCTDIDLIVMETDAISSASIRSLYLKIGDIVNEKKLYQVFNKASKEEYEIYSKVSGGTVFTNIDTILFDWKIRKSFAVSQIPDMQNTSANYGAQIYNLCSILFSSKNVQDKLARFKTILDMHMYQENAVIIREKIDRISEQYKSKRNSLTRSLSLLTMLLCSMILCVVFAVGISTFGHIEDTDLYLLIPIVLSLGTIMISVLNIVDSTKGKREYSREIDSLKEQLGDIEKKMIRVRKKMEETENIDKKMVTARKEMH